MLDLKDSRGEEIRITGGDRIKTDQIKSSADEYKVCLSNFCYITPDHALCAVEVA